MNEYTYTLVPGKKNRFIGVKFYLKNIPYNLKYYYKFKFKKNIKFTYDLKDKSKNNILIIDVNNLSEFSDKYVKYGSYNIFQKIDYKFKKDYGGCLIHNYNFNSHIFDYKYYWFFSEKNYSGYLFYLNLIS